MSWNKYVILLLGPAIILASTSFAQESNGSGQPSRGERSAYPDDAHGLRALLLNMLEVAKSGNTEQLKVLIKDTEIPNSEVWFTTTFGKDKGESWAGPYGTMLEENESHFQEHIIELSHQIGDITVRKLDAAEMFDTLAAPLDLFLADWNPSGAAKSHAPGPIGYFFFIDGKFRWDSTITFVKVQTVRSAADSAPSESTLSSNGDDSGIPTAKPGVGGVGYPACLYCPSPDLPKGATNLHVNVSVMLKAVIRRDGRATNIEVVRSGGSDFDEKAVEAVRRWRFRPALGPNRVPVAVVQLIEVHSRN